MTGLALVLKLKQGGGVKLEWWAQILYVSTSVFPMWVSCKTIKENWTSGVKVNKQKGQQRIDNPEK